MKTVIIEDERLAAETLERLLREIDPDIEVMAKLDSVKASAAWLASHSPDLIFMDIHLADDISFNLFSMVDIKAPVIFITAFDQYAIRAFKFNSIDYLLKPIDKPELVYALKKFASLRSISAEAIGQLLEQFSGTMKQYQKRFMVTTGQKIKSVDVSEVAHFYAEERVVFMITKGGEKYIVDFTIDRLENSLDPLSFFRINRRQLIAFSAIKGMHAYTKSRVKIDLNPAVPFDTIVSIDRSGAFKKWLNR